MSTTERGKALGTSIEANEVDIPTAGTAVQITTTTKCLKMFISNINAANAIYIGDSNVDKTNRRSIRLNAGERLELDIDNPSLVYADGTADGDDVGYLLLI